MRQRVIDDGGIEARQPQRRVTIAFAQDVAVDRRALAARKLDEVMRVGAVQVILKRVDPDLVLWRAAQQVFGSFSPCTGCSAADRALFQGRECPGRQRRAIVRYEIFGW